MNAAYSKSSKTFIADKPFKEHINFLNMQYVQV